MKLGLQGKLIIVFVILVSLVVASIVPVVNFIVKNEIREDIDDSLDASRRVFEKFMKIRFQRLLSEARVIGESPRLKGVIATPDVDHPTILYSAEQIQTLVKSDIFILTDADGIVTARVHNPEHFGDDISKEEIVARVLETGEPNSSYWVHKDKVLQVICMPLSFGDDMIGTFVSGYNIGDSLAKDIRSMTLSEAVFLKKGLIFASSLPKEKKIVSAFLKMKGSLIPQVIRLNKEHYIAVSFSLSKDVHLVLLRSLDQAMILYRRIKRVVFQVGFGVLLFSILIAAPIARGMIRPIRLLVKTTREVSEGNLDVQTEISGSDEIGELASSFNQMTSALRKRRSDLASLNQSAKQLSSTLDKRLLFENGLKALGDIIGFRRGAIGLIEGESKVYLKASMGETGSDFSFSDGSPCGVSLKENRVIATSMLSEKGSFPFSQDEKWWRGKDSSRIVVPLKVREEFRGFLLLEDSRQDAQGELNANDVEYSEIISASISVSLSNLELMEEAVEKTRMKEELKTAELVQKTLVPSSPPQLPQLDIASYFLSASETGGDWFGFFEDKKGRRLVMLMGDVTGHGVAAALVTSATNSFFRTIEFQLDQYYKIRERLNTMGNPEETKGLLGSDPFDPAEMLRLLNRVIIETTKGELVMTFFASVYDLDTGMIHYANAGHDPPLVYRKNGAQKPGAKPRKRIRHTECLPGFGLRLGDEEGASFTSHHAQIGPGDVLLVYTDGLTECENPFGEEYGEKRMKKCFEAAAGQDASGICEALRHEAFEFFSDCPRKDDITFFVAKVPET